MQMTLLGNLPAGLRDELLKEFNKVVTNYREGRWEAAELDIGKFCEVVYSILDGHVKSTFPVKAFKPASMEAACNLLASASGFPRSVRLQIPRMLISMYDVRNSRGVGHVGGEVDPNHMDATVVLHFAKWIMAELVRIFHAVDVATATAAVEALTERDVPLIWQVGTVKRVLRSNMPTSDKILLLLSSQISSISEKDLMAWTEYSHVTKFRKILADGHKMKLWEYDNVGKQITISPLGTAHVEDNIIPR
jgi:hypothetical protein